jgi:NAD(P)-dependent dehydrogenase (short-subunit alcohol dehydrogenase family)
MAGLVAGKVALVTGAAMGIGAATALALAQEGAAVLLTDIDRAAGEATAEAVRAAGGRAHFLFQDVADEAAWPEVVAQAEARFGKLDVAVANAGIAIMCNLFEMSLADWRRQTAINLDGVFLTAKHCVPAMARAGGGSLVMISSVAGLQGSPNLAGYSATKGAVRLFSKSVALACAQARNGVRCNSVHPGIIDTAIWHKMPAEGDSRRLANAPIDAKALGAMVVPVGHHGTAADIADGIVFLASDRSAHMTGAELVIDGGMTAGRAGAAAAAPPR